MSDGTPQTDYSRRGLLKAGTGAAAALAATSASGTALAQNAPYDGYLSDANLFNGKTADLTGKESVTVKVGAGASGIAFSPPAIKIDPGTTVTWDWTGEGGAHNVVAEDGTFDSGSTVSGSDVTFEYTFDSEGQHKYFCRPHKPIGMKGVVAVGDTAEGEVVPPSELGGGGGTPTPSGNGGGQFPAVSDYLANANGFDGVTDMTDKEEVTVKVGAGQGFAFAPAAIHISPGTKVTWEWTGKGGAHNVVAEDDSFNSGDPKTSGTFSHTFQEDATHLYYCNPHKPAGMKGAVVVGEGGTASGGGESQPKTAANQLALQTLLAMIALGLLSPIVFLLVVRRKMSGPPRPEGE